jgi:hypothetical protein
MADSFHPIHDTNDRRRSVAESQKRKSTFEIESEARNRRAGGAGSYAGDSAARMGRIRMNERRPGESQTATDTRRAQAKTQTGYFVPHSVRVTELKRTGLNQKDAERVADYQSSTAGQKAGTPQFGVGSAVASEREPKSAFDVGYEKQQADIESAEGAKQAYRDIYGHNPTDTEHGGTAPGTGAGSPVTNVGKAAINGEAAEKGEAPKYEPNDFGLSGANREERMEQAKTMPRTDGKKGTYFDQLKELTPAKQKQAQAYAKSKGMAYDPAKGYFNPEMGSKEWASTVAVAGKGKSKPAPQQSDSNVEATFQMPDGSMRSIRSDETVKAGFERARTSQNTAVATAEEPSEVKAPPKGGKEAVFAQPAPKASSPGGSVAEVQAKLDSAGGKPKPTFNPSRQTDNTQVDLDSGGIFYDNQPSQSYNPQSDRSHANEMKSLRSDAEEKISDANKLFKKRIASLKRGRRSQDISQDEIERAEQIAEENGWIFDPKKGFYKPEPKLETYRRPKGKRN